jgi:hypothetical protein
MKIKIAPEILSATTKCKREFVCLSNPKQCVCRVVHCVRNELLFVQKTAPDGCPYSGPFGEGCLCNCPTRKAIYQQYRI